MYFVLIWTLSLCNLCIIGLENKVIISDDQQSIQKSKWILHNYFSK